VSVLLPWHRSKSCPKSDKKQRLRLARRPNRPKSNLSLFTIFVFLVATIIVCCTHIFGQKHIGSILWQTESAYPIAISGDRFLLQSGEQITLWDASGKICDIPSPVDQALFIGDDLLLVRAKKVFAVTKAGTLHRLATVSDDEKILPALSVGRVSALLAFRPSDNNEFAGSWIIRQISLNGNKEWKSEIPYPPFLASRVEGKVFLGATDILSGGVEWLFCLDAARGRLLWKTKLGPGFWRGLFVTQDGKIVAVTESSLHAYSSDGHLLWNHTPDGRVMSSIAMADTVFISVLKEYPSPLTNILSRNNVMAFSTDGKQLWVRSTREDGLRLFPGGNNHIIALTPRRVIAFNIRSGESLFSAATKHCPIYYNDYLVLFQKSNRLILLRLAN